MRVLRPALCRPLWVRGTGPLLKGNGSGPGRDADATGRPTHRVQQAFLLRNPMLRQLLRSQVSPKMLPLLLRPKAQQPEVTEGKNSEIEQVQKIVPCYFGAYNYRARFRIAARWRSYHVAPLAKLGMVMLRRYADSAGLAV